MKKGNIALIIGGMINIGLFIGHLLCLFCLKQAFEVYKIDQIMNQYSLKFGDAFPYIITVIIAFCFLLFAAYALSSAGMLHVRLPLPRIGLYLIAIVFLVRSIGGVSILFSDYSTRELISTLVSGVIGILYLYGRININR